MRQRQLGIFAWMRVRDSSASSNGRDPGGASEEKFTGKLLKTFRDFALEKIFTSKPSKTFRDFVRGKALLASSQIAASICKPKLHPPQTAGRFKKSNLHLDFLWGGVYTPKDTT